MTPVTSLPPGGLYAITDCRHLTTGQLLERTEQILRAGAVMLQYRHKEADDRLKIDQAGMLLSLCKRFGVSFIVNNDPGLARLVRADGVHLGREDMDCARARAFLGPESIIGVSCYNELERVTTAASAGASYIALGAFYRSGTKPDAVRAEPELIGKAKQIVRLPVVAIGGITPENGKALVAAGADFLAVSSGLYAAADIPGTTQKYTSLFNKP